MARLTRQVGILITALWLMLASSAAFAGSPSVLTFTKSFGASSIALNGSTSLTFNLSLGNTGGGGGTGALGFTDSLPAGLVVSTPNGLSSISCSGGSTPGSVTATAGAGSITLSGMNLAMLGNCSFSVNVTGTAEGTKNNSVTTYASYVVGSTVTATASLTVAAVAAPTQPIPNSAPATPTAGIGTQPTTVDLSKGQGPDMTVCMMNAVKAMPGFGQAVYLGQDQFGVASIDLKDGRYLAFYPLAASTNSTRAPGLYFSSSNKAIVATSCGSFDVAPAVYNLSALGNMLNASNPGLRVSIGSDGVATYVVNDQTFVLRPDFYVNRNQVGIAGFTGTTAGQLFNDGAGNTQLLRAAFLDPVALTTAAAQDAVPGTLSITSDGTAIYTAIDGYRWALTAQSVLESVPASYANKLLWQIGSNAWYRGSTLAPLAQRFGVVNLGL